MLRARRYRVFVSDKKDVLAAGPFKRVPDSLLGEFCPNVAGLKLPGLVLHRYRAWAKVIMRGLLRPYNASIDSGVRIGSPHGQIETTQGTASQIGFCGQQRVEYRGKGITVQALNVCARD
jgi:hypothetical protein